MVYPSDLPSECTIRADSFPPALFEERLGRSQVMTKPDPKAKYLLAATYLVTS